jgi:alkanesulfonate monooxygenase SsuD/methylene tetrahydromethanopterin reductase-like flavin-dependent oxidoreductase (luciferase family)
LAKTIATLDYWTGGRVVIGAGYGWNAPEMANNGVDPKRNKAIFREKVRAMQALWSQETASFDGEFVQFSESWSWPKPIQQPGPPILIGAAPRAYAFKDVVELADGWMPDATWVGDRLEAERLPAALDELRHRMDEAGRDFSRLTIRLSGVTGFKKDTVEEIRERCPTPAQVAAWADLGVNELGLSVPVLDRDLFLKALDVYAELQAEVNR